MEVEPSLAVLLIPKRKDVNTDDVITEFADLKGRRLAICF